MRGALLLVGVGVLVVGCGAESKPAESASAAPATSSSGAAPAADAPVSPKSSGSAGPAASAAPSSAGQGDGAGAAASSKPVPTDGSVVVGDILGTKKFNPKAVIDGTQPALLDCYNKARASNASLSGKVTLRVVVNDAGNVVAVEAEKGGSANDPGLVRCIGDVWKKETFPKPGGTAAVIAPLLFRP